MRLSVSRAVGPPVLDFVRPGCGSAATDRPKPHPRRTRSDERGANGRRRGGGHTAYDRAVTTTTGGPTPLALLLLGRGRDLASERGVECPGDLPAASDPDLVERARAAKAALGDRVFVLGHHYQRDEVIAVRRRHR